MLSAPGVLVETEKLVAEVRQLKETLTEIEQRLATSHVPRAVVEDLKAAVDHIRLSLWAMLSAGEHEKGAQTSTLLARFRLRRAEEILSQITQDIGIGAIESHMPELPKFFSALKHTLDVTRRTLRLTE